jgi:predicted transcriptional regulator/transcriptional regulator with XRE-family HTH domain
VRYLEWRAIAVKSLKREHLTEGHSVPTNLPTGSRIRDRRLDRGMKQTDLAAAVGISASYLNLIEHNARRIGGKLLIDIARALAVDPAHLAESAARGTLAALRAAAADAADLAPELVRTEDFAGRFPGWAALVALQAARIGRLESQVAELSDRLTHDPELASSLHAVITAVTSIRSTSAILIDEPDLDRDWTGRFHRNIHDDSIKLAEASRALVQYFEAAETDGSPVQSPQDAVARYLDAIGHHVAALEAEGGATDAVLADAVARAPALGSAAARRLLGDWLERYRSDALALPLELFGAAARAADHDPTRLAVETGADPALVMRRLATLPATGGHPPLGLAICDAAGALIVQRRIPGFALPRVGAGCPLWPVYGALNQPGRGIAAMVALPGERGTVFRAWAVAGPRGGAGFDPQPLVDATMLVRPVEPGYPTAAASVRPVGLSCRICPRDGCAARREPSVVGGGKFAPE